MKYKEKMIHEQLYIFPSGFRARWCEHCAVLHGYLYSCKYFSPEIQEKIRREDNRKKAGLGVSIAIMILFVILLSI